MLISTDDLHSILDDSDVIVVDTRSFKEYSEGHIPNSVNLDLFAFHWIDTTDEGIGNFNRQARSLMSFLGAAPEKKLIFYDNISGMLAARGVWMSLYLSHENTFMLDGGMRKWNTDNLPVETKPNPLKPSKFSGKINQEIVSGFEYIRENMDSIKILDARSAGEYNGTVIRAARGGHIPKSLNIDWTENVNDDGTFKNEEDLSQLYDYPKDSEIITYCQGAYRAANTFLVLRKLGFKNVRVYLGSWGEWGNLPELPVEN